MRTQKVFQLVFLVLFICLSLCLSACTEKNAPFEKAISEAHQSKLDEINVTLPGVPFYSVKTLDPNWEESGNTQIVKIPELHLVDQNGKNRNEALFEGKITFLAFFFSSCSGFCPTFLKHLQDVQNRLKNFSDIQFVAISVDPETDTPQRLNSYFKRMKFDPKTWTLLTGDRTLIYSLARETLASEAFQLPKTKNQIAHSEHFFVLDPERRLRGALKGTRLDVAESAYELISALLSDLKSKQSVSLKKASSSPKDSIL